MKQKRVYICQSCGHQEPKWLGRCPGCEAWSSLVEEVVTASSGAQARLAKAIAASDAEPVRLSDITLGDEPRLTTGIAELDCVLGGGLVPGSLVLVGGDPGIGKSTLLLQAFANLAQRGLKTLYITAEESLRQVKLRADRLGIQSDLLFLLAETQLDRALEIRKKLQPQVLVVDSIQTVGVNDIDSSIGSVSQIRAVTHKLMEVAKGEGIATFVVGHVTKEGTLAGPKVMEHMVDTVLYFEGDRSGPYRILRAHKNRFGSAQEIGVFEMQANGLKGVSNPSALFLSQRAAGPGATVITSMEGSRPILLEVQSLTTAALYGNPRRTCIGFDPQRVSMLCAVLGSRAGLDLSSYDVYVNMAGGVRVQEPGADLGVVLALASTYQRIALPQDMVVMGEVGLSGEIRSVSQIQARVQECVSLGFSRCVIPKIDLEAWAGKQPDIMLLGVSNLSEALEVSGLRG